MPPVPATVRVPVPVTVPVPEQPVCGQAGAEWCAVVYAAGMATTAARPLRQSVSLPPRLARHIRTLARAKKTSASRVIVDLVESGLDAQEQERKRFFELADRLARSTDAKEQRDLKEELARLTFGS